MVQTYGAEDLEKLWEAALKKYKEKTGKDLQHDPTLTVEEMVDEIDKSFPGSESRDVVVKQSLERVILLGADVAGEVASGVFPGAGILFTAARPLMDITHHYQRYYTARSVDDTLEKILPHFKRVQGYIESARQGARINEALMSLIFRILTHFLNICAIYCKVLESSQHKRGRFKNLCKSIIGLDGGIQQELDGIETLARQEGEQNSAETNGVLLREEGRRLRVRNRKLIKDTLKIEENKHFLASGVEMQDKLQKEYVKGIGLWLPALEEFSTWMDVEHPAAPVLALEADEGYGKTHLCSEVIKMLQESQRRQKDRKSCVAFFYFKSLEKGRTSKEETKGPGNGNEENGTMVDSIQDGQMSLKDALISMIWQLTMADEEYQRFVVSKMEHPTGLFSNVSGLWKMLIGEYAKRANSKRNKVFFFVIDGLDSMVVRGTEKKDITDVIEEIRKMARGNFQIRLLITGNSKVIQDLEINSGDNSALIRIPDHRTGDIEAFVKSKMLRIIRDQADEDQTDLLLRIENKFCESEQYTSGSYLEVIPALDEVAETYGNKELQDILDRHPEDSSGAVVWQLKTLQSQLDPSEIEEFNDVLICMVLLTIWPSIKQLTTFLWLSKDTRHQLLLEHRIRHKYIKFYKLSDDNIVRSQETWEHFLAPPTRKQEPSFSDDTTDSHNEANEPDIAFMKKLTHAICHGELSDRLEQLLQTLAVSTPRIDFDIVEGHVKIILCILRAVCSWRRKSSEFLHDYAAAELLTHFGKVTLDQLRTVPTHVRQEIGYLFHGFFVEQDSVDTWVKQKSSRAILNALFKNGMRTPIHKALMWQQDEHVRKGIQKAGKPRNYEYRSLLQERPQSPGDGNSIAWTDDDAESTNELNIDPEQKSQAKISIHQEDPNDIGRDPVYGKETEKVEAGRAEEEERNESEKTGPIPEEAGLSEGVTLYQDQMNRGGADTTSQADGKSKEPSYPNTEEGHKHYDLSPDKAAQSEVILEVQHLIEAPKNALVALWLDKDDWDPQFGLSMLMDMLNVGRVQSTSSCNGNEWQKMASRSIIEVWNWTVKVLGKAEDPQWSKRHTRLAETALAILANGPLDPQTPEPGALHNLILKQCCVAKKKDKTNWRADWCIAKSQMRQSKPKAGTHPALETLEALLKDRDKTFRNKHKNQHDEILDSFLSLCAEESLSCRAVRAFGDLAEKFPSDVDLIKKGFEWIGDRNDRASLKKLISTLVRMPDKAKQSPMTTLLHRHAGSPEFHDSLWAALYDDPGLVIKCYTDAIKATVSISVVARGHLRFYHALTLYYQQNLERATEVWESIKLERSHFRAHPELRQLQAQISEKLALCYVQLTRSSIAMTSQAKGETEYMRKISALIRDGGEGEETVVTDVRYLTLSLCRIYTLNGQMEKAKSCVSGYVKAATDLLSNDTFDDDCKGFVALGEILVALGDKENAKIAWSMINDMDDGRRFDLPLFCDGGCGCMWEAYPDKEIYICNDCVDIHLDKQCYEKLRSGTLRQRVCGKYHGFFVVKKWDGKARKELKDSFDRAGNSGKMTENWVALIKAKYVVKQTDNEHQRRRAMRFHGAAENLKKFFRRRVPVSEYIWGSGEL